MTVRAGYPSESAVSELVADRFARLREAKELEEECKWLLQRENREHEEKWAEIKRKHIRRRPMILSALSLGVAILVVIYCGWSVYSGGSIGLAIVSVSYGFWTWMSERAHKKAREMAAIEAAMAPLRPYGEIHDSSKETAER